MISAAQLVPDEHERYGSDSDGLMEDFLSSRYSIREGVLEQGKVVLMSGGDPVESAWRNRRWEDRLARLIDRLDASQLRPGLL